VKFRTLLLVPVLAASILGVGCNSSSDPTPAAQQAAAAFVMQLLHAADQEGNGESVQNAPRFSAVLNALRAEFPNSTLVLSSGDNYIPGPFFSSSEDPTLAALVGVEGEGRGDIVINNALGFQASAIGNHEFDTGPVGFAGLIGQDGAYPGAAFPYLSANLDMTPDPDLGGFVVPSGNAPQPNSITGSVVIAVNGENIGVVGATTPTLEDISSTGDDVVVNPASDATADLAAVIQQAVDALTAQGIDKIILLAHMQVVSIELELATLLRDVDIIVAGGSDSIFVDGTDRVRTGDTVNGNYPEFRTSASGEPVAVVNTDGQYRYVGRLVIGFDEDGVLIPGTYDPAQSGAFPTDDQGVTDLGNPAPDPLVEQIAAAIGDVLIATEGNTFGKSSVYLNGMRGSVRTEETNMGNLTADANLAFAKTVDASTVISLKNGGGIRNEIGRVVVAPGGSDTVRLPTEAIPIAGKEEGEISELDIKNALSFNNGLTLVTVTAQQLVALLEHGVAETGVPAEAQGRFPQVSGVRFSFDAAQAAGSKLVNVVVTGGAAPDVVMENGVIQGDANRTFRLVTLGFLAGGGDGYPFPQDASADVVDLDIDDDKTGPAQFADTGTEQDVLAEFLAASFPPTNPFDFADTPANEDQRIQNLAVPGTVDTILTN